MPKIKLEDTHALVEKLVEYVMNEVSKKAEVETLSEYVMNEVATKNEVNEIKKDVKDNKQKINILLNGQDKIVKELGDIRTEQVATNSALLRHEKRITALEQKIH